MIRGLFLVKGIQGGEVWRDIRYLNTSQKKAGEVMLISDRADFRPRKDNKDKERHYRMTKGSVLQKDII